MPRSDWQIAKKPWWKRTDPIPRWLSALPALISANNLPADYADGRNPYVRDKFGELWRAAQYKDEY